MVRELFLITALSVFVSVPAAGQKPRSRPASPSGPSAKPSTPPPPVKCGPNGLAASEITEILAEHNKARSDQKLPSLIWDCKLADYAQEWASKGTVEHRDTDYGENLFVSSNGSERITTVVKTWMNERQNWDDKAGACQPGKVCAHYTQVMWNRTTRVGCGVRRNGTEKWRTFLVCNYDPAGNTGGPPF